jgi:hypothetical protein
VLLPPTYYQLVPSGRRYHLRFFRARVFVREDRKGEVSQHGRVEFRGNTFRYVSGFDLMIFERRPSSDAP